MTLVDNDEIEKLRIKLLIGLWDVGIAPIFVYELLVRGEENLVCAVKVLALHFCCYTVERLEVSGYCLIEQDVTIGEVQDLFCQSSLAKAPYDLKRSVCFACACCHHEKHALLALSHCLDDAVDGDALVIARRYGVVTVIVGDVCACRLFFGEAMGNAMALPELVGSGKRVERYFPLRSGGHVMFHEGLPI